MPLAAAVWSRRASIRGAGVVRAAQEKELLCSCRGFRARRAEEPKVRVNGEGVSGREWEFLEDARL